MRLSRRETVLLGLLIVLAGFYLTDHYLLKPLYFNKRQIIEENNRLVVEIQKWEEKTREYQAEQQEAPEIQADYRQMLEKVPDLPMISDVIDYLEASAREAQVRLVSIQYRENPDAASHDSETPGSADRSLKSLNYQIVACGSHYNLLSFMLKIENAPRTFIINSSKIYLTRNGPYSAGAAGESSVNGTDAEMSREKAAVPESMNYDMKDSVLNLDFNAYYSTSPGKAGQL